MLKCLLFRGLHWFYRAFIFCYFSTVFITVNLKAFLPFVFFQLPKLNIKTCRVVPEPLRPAGLTTLLQISADSCVYCTHQPSTHRVGFYWVHARGVYTVYLSHLSYWETDPVSVGNASPLSSNIVYAQLCRCHKYWWREEDSTSYFLTLVIIIKDNFRGWPNCCPKG